MRQQLAILMLERQNSDTKLPPHFWNLPQFKKQYQHQLRLATRLLKTYSEETISNVLNKEIWIYSLGLKKLDTLLLEEQTRLSRQQYEHRPQVIEPQNTTFVKKPIDSFKKV